MCAPVGADLARRGCFPHEDGRPPVYFETPHKGPVPRDAVYLHVTRALWLEPGFRGPSPLRSLLRRPPGPRRRQGTGRATQAGIRAGEHPSRPGPGCSRETAAAPAGGLSQWRRWLVSGRNTVGGNVVSRHDTVPAGQISTSTHLHACRAGAVHGCQHPLEISCRLPDNTELVTFHTRGGLSP